MAELIDVESFDDGADFDSLDSDLCLDDLNDIVDVDVQEDILDVESVHDIIDVDAWVDKTDGNSLEDGSEPAFNKIDVDEDNNQSEDDANVKQQQAFYIVKLRRDIDIWKEVSIQICHEFLD